MESITPLQRNARFSHIGAYAIFGDRPAFFVGCFPAVGDLLGYCSIVLRLGA
jgi:hypothetical protein